MRRATVYLTVGALIVFAVAVAWVAADWPHWCRILGWCVGRGPL